MRFGPTKESFGIFNFLTLKFLDWTASESFPHGDANHVLGWTRVPNSSQGTAVKISIRMKNFRIGHGAESIAAEEARPLLSVWHAVTQPQNAKCALPDVLWV